MNKKQKFRVVLTFPSRKALDHWIGWYLDGNGEQDFFQATDERYPGPNLDDKCYQDDENYPDKYDRDAEEYAAKWYPKVKWDKK